MARDAVLGAHALVRALDGRVVVDVEKFGLAGNDMEGLVFLEMDVVGWTETAVWEFGV